MTKFSYNITSLVHPTVVFTTENVTFTWYWSILWKAARLSVKNWELKFIMWFQRFAWFWPLSWYRKVYDADPNKAPVIIKRSQLTPWILNSSVFLNCHVLIQRMQGTELLTRRKILFSIHSVQTCLQRTVSLVIQTRMPYQTQRGFPRCNPWQSERSLTLRKIHYSKNSYLAWF